MLKCKFLVTFAALSLLFASAVSAQTLQEGLSGGPSARPFGTSDDTIIDDEFFEYDARLWTPYDITSLDGAVEPQSGFYAELGFTYLSISGPEAVAGADPRLFENADQWTWGRNLEVGYRQNRDTGWSFQWQDLEGSTFLFDSEFVFSEAFGGLSNPAVLRTAYDRLSINREFRQTLSNGGYVEPFIGIEYISLRDFANQDILPPVLIPAARFSQKATNSAIGGRLGTSYTRNYGRYSLGANLAAGAYYNQQNFSSTVLGPVGTTAPGLTLTNRDNDFAPLLDLGGTIRINLTRDISLRGGAQLTYIWQGVTRADTRTALANPVFAGLAGFPTSIEDQDFIAAGFNFGIDWRR